MQRLAFGGVWCVTAPYCGSRLVVRAPAKTALGHPGVRPAFVE
jgi:hypothetical protein